MKISPELFQAQLKCPTKCWLRAAGEASTGNTYAEWVKTQDESYREKETAQLVRELPNGEVATAPTAENLKSAKWKLATNVAVQTQVNACPVESGIHAVERIPSEGRGRAAQFIPIRFIWRNKLTKDDKLLLAFDAFVLAQALGRDIALGKIIHGDLRSCVRSSRGNEAPSGNAECGVQNTEFNQSLLTSAATSQMGSDDGTSGLATGTPARLSEGQPQPRVTKVKTSVLAGEVRKVIDKIAALLTSEKSPDLVLNRHCPECEFRDRCRQKAVETDDLSLLAGMSAKERQRLRSKGIFTVTQLSYTFRPRRRPKRLRDKREKYHHALKALAIREKKIHIVGQPELNIEGTPVYLDVEGLPDRDFYYLIGLRIGNGDTAVQHSLWADSVEDEGKIWREFLGILETVEKPVLIHYGSYETTFLKCMKERYGAPAEGSRTAYATEMALNLLAVLFGQVYFPRFTNGLKEIARSLGSQWSNPYASGLDTVVWRLNWEQSEEKGLKQMLMTYNAEDCDALARIVAAVKQLSQTQAARAQVENQEIIHTDSMKRETPFHFGNNRFAVQDMERINRAAYWDHQRANVYVKSNKRMARISPDGELRRLKHSVRINKVVECSSPAHCPTCGSGKLEKREGLTKIVQDIKFGHGSIKRWNIRYYFNRYFCCDCRSTFLPSERPWTGSKFGKELMAYAIYLVIDLFLPQYTVAKSLNELFRFRLDRSHINHLKSGAAKLYQVTFDGILNRIAGGRLIHADETKISIAGTEAYVWVITNLEDVAYFYTESREAECLQPVLGNFKGVLVTDFYAAYDSFSCPQQKCLIHLMRDLNDDLLKQPFNEELRKLTQDFAELLKSMIKTIDRFGLKARFLRRHKAGVERFYKELSKWEFATETAVKIKKRLEKNRDKLFTFLEYDGIPWNNNNAEHTIKAFSKIRRIVGGTSTEKGMREYLVLLSIRETCRYRSVNFLDFLRFGEKDIHGFAESQRRRRKPAPAGGSPQSAVNTALGVNRPATDEGQPF